MMDQYMIYIYMDQSRPQTVSLHTYMHLAHSMNDPWNKKYERNLRRPLAAWTIRRASIADAQIQVSLRTFKNMSRCRRVRIRTFDVFTFGPLCTQNQPLSVCTKTCLASSHLLKNTSESPVSAHLERQPSISRPDACQRRCDGLENIIIIIIPINRFVVARRWEPNTTATNCHKDLGSAPTWRNV